MSGPSPGAPGPSPDRALGGAIEFLGKADVYVVDHLLRGAIAPGMRVLDAGCGRGRNGEPLLRDGRFDVHALDASETAVAHVRGRFAELAPHLPAENVRRTTIEEADLPAAGFDVVLCLAVLHFARDVAHFDAMLTPLWRTLRPGGLFLARLGTLYGVDGVTTPLGGDRHRMPDGKEWVLLPIHAIEERTGRVGGSLEGPLRTTVVHGKRSMSTWIARKNGGATGG